MKITVNRAAKTKCLHENCNSYICQSTLLSSNCMYAQNSFWRSSHISRILQRSYLLYSMAKWQG